MPNVQSIIRLAQDTQQEITSSGWAWTNFLLTASRLYRYSFPDQLLIHAQRPDATACASFELWKETMRRFVRRGSKGIALIDDTSDQLSVKYVFDVSDTGESPRLNSRSPNLWEFEPHHTHAVSEMLQSSYDAKPNFLHAQLYQVARSLAEEYYADHEAEMLEATEDSIYDEAPLVFAEEYTATLINSVA